MTCGTCGEKGAVFRPERVVTVPVMYREHIRDTVTSYHVNIEERHGGLDACPECAQRAEAEWDMRGRGA